MMTPRVQKLWSAVNALGPLVVGRTIPGDGWPGTCFIQLANEQVNVALHVSSISPHSRKSYELRFQNPAGGDCPVSDLNGTALPILLGLDDPISPTIFVAIDGRDRVGRQTRFSILFHNRIIDEARARGWAVYKSSTGENIFAFVPAMLPSFIEQINVKDEVSVKEISEAAIASGVLDFNTDPYAITMAAQRATRAVSVLARKAGIGHKIRSAYGGTCAMCGLGSGLVQGAHIYPVEAPGSADEIWNGMSLCYNHHRAFDMHMIGINLDSSQIILHPSLHLAAMTNPGTANFINSTWKYLQTPAHYEHKPNALMFKHRYEYFEGEYDWM